MKVSDLIEMLLTFPKDASVVVTSEGIAKRSAKGMARVGQPHRSKAVLNGFSEEELLREDIDAMQLTGKLVVIFTAVASNGEIV